MFFCILDDNNPSQWPLTFEQLREALPNVSFSLPIDDQSVSGLGVAIIHSSTKPSFNPATHKVQELAPVFKSGQWKQQWEAVLLSTQEQVAINQNQATTIRSNRNARLAESDWTQLADSPVNKSAWLDYRQALRDVPSLIGFPWNVIWPEAPTN